MNNPEVLTQPIASKDLNSNQIKELREFTYGTAQNLDKERMYRTFADMLEARVSLVSFVAQRSLDRSNAVSETFEYIAALRGMLGTDTKACWDAFAAFRGNIAPDLQHVLDYMKEGASCYKNAHPNLTEEDNVYFKNAHTAILQTFIFFFNVETIEG